MKLKLVYVWLDGHTPEPNLRSKIKIAEISSPHFLDFYPTCNFDGSSTNQANSSLSDCYLKPVRTYVPKNINELSTVYVFCEVYDSEDKPVISNDRVILGEEDTNFWVGFEQEYFIRYGRNKDILGFHKTGLVEPQGIYYCGVGGQMVGRNISNRHLDMCLNYGINIEGANADVALGQWEYQIFSKGKIRSCDDLWMSRYFLYLIAEEFGYDIELQPKPILTGWNGSGLHTNFSNQKMRESGDKNYFDAIFKIFSSDIIRHIENYGSNNNLRLTGEYGTQSIDKFTWGISDRSASIRVPKSVGETWKGYLEDRRPASNANPYKVIKVIYDSVELAFQLEKTLSNMYNKIENPLKTYNFNGAIRETKKFSDIISKSEEIINKKMSETKNKFNESLRSYMNDDDDETNNPTNNPTEIQFNPEIKETN